MNQQQLLRRLRVLARDRDTRGVRATLAELGRHSGWANDVMSFVQALPVLERSFVNKIIGPTPGDEFGTYVGEGPNGQSFGAVATAPVSAVDPFAGVTKDATSGIYCPSSSGEWSTFISAAGLNGVIAVPDALHLLQEASGNPADSIGSITLTTTGTPTFQTAESGWSRKGIAFTDGQAAELSTTSASLPSISTNSFASLVYADVTASGGASRCVIQHGTTTVDQTRVTNTPRLQVASGANTTTGSASPLGVVRPYGLRTNRTAGSTTGNTDAEKLVPTFGSPTNKKLGLGASANVPGMNVLYAVHWFNANAEISDANWKLLLQALNWTIGWT